MLKKICYLLLFMSALLLLCSCGNSYTRSDIEDAERDAYYKGYDDGYQRGSEDQWEKDCEDFLIDTYSIRDIENRVYQEFGITPSEAFSIVDNYEYDSTHGGYTWTEYQYAIDAIYYTASIFPYDY